MIPLEDSAADIIGKAQRGLQISDSELAERSNLTAEQIRAARDGAFDEATVLALAPVLGLHAESLLKLSRSEWTPEQLEPIAGLAQFNTTYGDMTVNAYLVWDPKTREAAAFDTGADSGEMLKRAALEDLSFTMILLTHAHPDHIEDLTRLRADSGAPVYVPENEPVPDAKIIGDDEQFELGSLTIEARLTSGHSAGGLTYVVRGLARPVAIVGDSMFAGSMGGGAVSYPDALRNNLEEILTLPDDTIVCPGHGPLTTVGKEKRENPFFAASFAP
ncbi:MAG: MBL-fold metallo-hydrolase superfamily [uncultured Chthoniobacterales bacterium]|uniref:MBL-fold metallo-hydrolase superfamily n=1 Tax=uncultured Chthoniobacterales bacterium TaxID=1836801 RepID=A0A6J4IM09_9BACT|nr:MAG: MBL-fold metallo-hydrolase superfamily [uncultured Chthoniobacterales bacterium]